MTRQSAQKDFITASCYLQEATVKQTEEGFQKKTFQETEFTISRQKLSVERSVLCLWRELLKNTPKRLFWSR